MHNPQADNSTPDKSENNTEHATLMSLGFPAPRADNCTVPKTGVSRRFANKLREFAHEERGAVTAEYALIIMAAVAFAGLLIAILRSDEVRAMLVNLVETALASAG